MKYLNLEGKFTRGQYRGETADEVAFSDPDYIEYLLTHGDFDDDVEVEFLKKSLECMA